MIAMLNLCYEKVTSPTATTTCTGNAVCQINWEDNGVTPSLAQFGATEVFLGVGNAQQQVSNSIYLFDGVSLMLLNPYRPCSRRSQAMLTSQPRAPSSSPSTRAWVETATISTCPLFMRVYEVLA